MVRETSWHKISEIFSRHGQGLLGQLCKGTRWSCKEIPRWQAQLYRDTQNNLEWFTRAQTMVMEDPYRSTSHVWWPILSTWIYPNFLGYQVTTGEVSQGPINSFLRLVYTKFPSHRQDDGHHIRQPKTVELATATRWNREITWIVQLRTVTPSMKQCRCSDGNCQFGFQRLRGHLDRTKFLFRFC